MPSHTKPFAILLAALALPLLAAGAQAQHLAVQEVPLTAAHVLYDSANGKVYASIPGTAALHPNTVAQINAATGTVEAYIAVGSQPDVLALSSDGSYLYVGTDDASGVARINLASNTVDQQFFLPTSPQSPQNHYHAGNIVPLPGLPQSVAVTLDYFNGYPTNDGVAIFDNGVQRPNRLGGAAFSSLGAFNPASLTASSTASRLYIYGSSSSAFAQLTVDASGVTLGQTATLMSSGNGYNSSIKFDPGSGLVYTTGGQAFDPNTSTVTGTYPVLTGPYASTTAAVLPSHAENRVYFLTSATSFANPELVTITAFNQATFQQAASFTTTLPSSTMMVTTYGSLGDLFEISPTRFVFHSDRGVEFASAQTATSIAVTPARPTVAVGKTDPFTATATFADGTTEDVTSSAAWSSDNTSVATISNSDAYGNPAGVVRGIVSGTANITATVNGITSSPFALTVTPAHYQVLWDNADGRASVWNYNADNGTYTHREYGPYPGWTAKAIAQGGTDEETRVLWNNTDGRASLWMLDNTAGTFTPYIYGPYAGWTANSVSVTGFSGNGGTAANNLLWNNTGGQSAFWTQFPTPFGSFDSYLFGPFSGWSAQAVASSTSPYNPALILETNTDGRISLLNAEYSPVQLGNIFGPYPGWTASAISSGANNVTHVLWNNTDGRMSLWDYNVGINTFTHNEYGPFAGWTANALADGSDGKTLVLWDNANGSASLWSLNNTSGVYTHAEFGPFAGWTAKGVSGN